MNQISQTKKKCFSIMPFEPGFDDIDNIIEAAAHECGLEYVRGDRRNQSGSILAQILQDIRSADIVVADITGNNPNVLYELGIAHQLRGSERVVIITRSSAQSPYDVHEFRQFDYQHTEKGRAELRLRLPGVLRAAMEKNSDQEMWNVVRGRVSRTRLIVRDLQRVATISEATDLRGVIIRQFAGLSSLAISDHEPTDPDEGADYNALLVAERNALQEILRRGGKFKCILNPARRFTPAMLPDRLKRRYERFLGLLEGRSDITNDARAAAEDVAMMKQCEFALSPVPMPNQLIIGDTVAYEGMKRGGGRGYEMTHFEIDREAVGELVTQFDKLFAVSLQQLQSPDQLRLQLQAFYNECIKTAGMDK